MWIRFFYIENAIEMYLGLWSLLTVRNTIKARDDAMEIGNTKIRNNLENRTMSCKQKILFSFRGSRSFVRIHSLILCRYKLY